MKKMLSAVVFGFLGVAASVSAIAAPMLDVDAQGILIGASNIDVGGSSYNVRFLDGSCVDLFAGCDSNADFPFPQWTSPASITATQAMMVLGEILSSSAYYEQPTKISGCNSAANICTIITPHFYSDYANRHLIVQTDSLNIDIPALHSINFYNDLYYINRNQDTLVQNGVSDLTWARWTLNAPSGSTGNTSSVPEPTSIALLALGVAALWLRRRREVRIK